MSNNVDKLKTTLEKNKIKGLALDIDETLSWTISYWVTELNNKFGNPDNLTVEQIYKKYKLAQNVPFWQTDGAYEWMERARQSNAVQEILPLIEHSNTTVQLINKIIPIKAYITIRSEKVISGTKKWLKKHDFPMAEVIAKPNHISYANGSEWKASVMTNLYPNILGIIDDTPAIIDFLPDDYNGYIFLYNNLDHPKKGSHIIPCDSWSDTYSKVKNVFGNKML